MKSAHTPHGASGVSLALRWGSAGPPVRLMDSVSTITLLENMIRVGPKSLDSKGGVRILFSLHNKSSIPVTPS